MAPKHTTFIFTIILLWTTFNDHCCTAQSPEAITAALEFERTTWASNLSVDQDPFYAVDSRFANVTPGTLIKVEDTDPANYLIPPSTALRRIVYQSEDVEGNPVPASAFVLIPYTPRLLEDGRVPVALWAHGTSGSSGFHPNCAPSHHRDLWQHYMAPIPLSLSGYAVVAPDYAGLGVGVDGFGKPIAHEWFASQAAANDLQFALEAARFAMSFLSEQFVVVGHSQGGGAVWKFAENRHDEPIDGFLGAVAIAPLTRWLEQASTPNLGSQIVGMAVMRSIAKFFPGFNISSVLTAEGERRLELDDEARGCTGVSIYIFNSFDTLKEGWQNNTFVRDFQEFTAVGGKPIGGPLLVIHGENDPMLFINATDQAVKQTAASSPGNSLTYLRYANITHGPPVWAAQSLWIGWINDRFDGKSAQPGLHQRNMKPFSSDLKYQKEMTWYPEFATQFYHTP